MKAMETATAPPQQGLPEIRVVHCKKEPADVYIGRPGPYGNPFPLDDARDDAKRVAVLQQYRDWIDYNPDFRRFVKQTLQGKTLGCWCAPRLCHGDVLKEVAEDPLQPSEDPIFVFGSNLAGRHGKGAALHAARWCGALRGQGEGRQGRAYAIPTKDADLGVLPLSKVRVHIDRFIEYASSQPSEDFDVTAIGCGLAGYKHAEVAPLFANAPPNCRLPGLWLSLLGRLQEPRIIIAGSRNFEDAGYLRAEVDRLTSRLDKYCVVSGGAAGADTLGENHAVANGLRMLRLPADWDRYGKPGGFIRNARMAFLGTHLIAFWDGRSPGTRGMIETAQAAGLAVKVRQVEPSAAPPRRPGYRHA